MGSKNSWRLQFIDIDSSFTINTEASTIKGYMVVRAPKGEKNPYYFEKGNMEAIYAMVGVPTSNWPDLYEAEAFNQEYGLYISAPAGSSASYPSYFGGSYITSKGLIDFYNVTGKDVVDYTQMVQVGFENAQGYRDSNVNIIVNPEGVGGASGYPTGELPDGTKDNVAVYITGITAKVWANVQEIGLNYWGDEKSGFEEGVYYYSVNKTDHKLYVENKDGDVVTDFYCGVWWKAEDGTYSVMIGGNSWVINNSSFKTGQATALNTLAELGITATSTNDYNNSDAPLLTLTDLLPNVELACAMQSSKYSWNNVVAYLEDGNSFGAAAASVDPNFLGVEIIVDGPNGKTMYETTSTYVSPKNRYQGITWLLNVKADTYGYIVQKSPAEVTTEVTITGIGYDKWKYDFAAPLIIGDLKKIDRTVLDNLNYNNDDNLFLNIEGSYSGNELIVPEKAAAAKKIKLYSYNPDLDKTKYPTAAKASANVGESYLTQSVLIYGVKVLSNNAEVATQLDDNTTTLQIDHEIVYVVSPSNFQFETEGDANYPLVKDINFNTMTFNVKEEVYPGEMMSGGEFTGSFDEKGKDGFGANIYWPNVLNDDDMSFIEIHPDKTFDEDLDSHGIFTKKRIVDDKLTYDVEGNIVPVTYKLKLKGQRYATYAVEKNLAEGTVGGSWRDEFMMIVKQGWTEAFDAQYDDVYVFMDPTGQEFVHTQHASLVETHKLAMAISPKLITQGEFANPSKLTVTGRSKQTAQYAGEFQFYDAYTGKSFWMMPIGDVGLMYCRIIERKMGGWAPAWYNYNNMGGQLPRAILKARWNFSDSATKIMDEKGINPIVYNADDGLMCVSSKTTQDPNNVTDWSEVGHVLAFLLCKREIRDNVMRQQIKKPIDDYWMGVRQEQVEAILAKRTVGSNKIWAKAVCDIAGVNNDTTKAMKKFYIYVKVKVNVFSEYVVLVFENVGQTTNI